MKQLIEILDELKSNGKYIGLSLYPDYGKTTIEKEGNRLFINEGRSGKFDNISENFYDELVDKYDSRG
jgi:hypothetical protein